MKALLSLVTLLSLTQFAHAGAVNLAVKTTAEVAEKASRNVAIDFQKAFMLSRFDLAKNSKIANAERLFSAGKLADQTDYKISLMSVSVGTKEQPRTATFLKIASDTHDQEMIEAFKKAVESNKPLHPANTKNGITLSQQVDEKDLSQVVSRLKDLMTKIELKKAGIKPQVTRPAAAVAKAEAVN